MPDRSAARRIIELELTAERTLTKAEKQVVATAITIYRDRLRASDPDGGTDGGPGCSCSCSSQKD